MRSVFVQTTLQRETTTGRPFLTTVEVLLTSEETYIVLLDGLHKAIFDSPNYSQAIKNVFSYLEAAHDQSLKRVQNEAINQELAQRESLPVQRGDQRDAIYDDPRSNNVSQGNNGEVR